MTQIDFYVNAPDKLHLACLLSLKALGQDRRVLFYTPDAQTTTAMDRLLWTFSALSFVPHCRSDDLLAAETPVIIDHELSSLPHHEILVNLQSECPPVFSRFERLIEIVGNEEADKAAARARYRFYRDRGYALRTHDVGKTGSD